MSAVVLAGGERRTWGLAGAVALAAHGAAVIALLLAVRPAPEPVPEPVVLVELPAEAAPASAVAATRSVQPTAQQSLVQPQMPAPPLDLPTVRAPLPADPVTLPPPSPVRAAPAPGPAPAQAAAVANAGNASGASQIAGSDPRAKQAEVDYRAIVNAYLARRKSYPVEAKKAHQEGTVAIRFTVDRSGAVSDVRMIRGSGHQILDAATIALLQRVAPLPRMPASVQRDSMPMAVAIEYSLKTS